MPFLQDWDYKRVLLEVSQLNAEEGRGTCIEIYVGFMTIKKVYVKLVSDSQDSSDFPKYIRVRKGKLSGFENYTELIDENFSTVSANVRELVYQNGISLSEMKGVKILPPDDIAISIIERIWTDELILKALSRNYMLPTV